MKIKYSWVVGTHSLLLRGDSASAPLSDEHQPIVVYRKRWDDATDLHFSSQPDISTTSTAHLDSYYFFHQSDDESVNCLQRKLIEHLIDSSLCF